MTDNDIEPHTTASRLDFHNMGLWFLHWAIWLNELFSRKKSKIQRGWWVIYLVYKSPGNTWPSSSYQISFSWLPVSIKDQCWIQTGLPHPFFLLFQASSAIMFPKIFETTVYEEQDTICPSDLFNPPQVASAYHCQPLPGYMYIDINRVGHFLSPCWLISNDGPFTMPQFYRISKKNSGTSTIRWCRKQHPVPVHTSLTVTGRLSIHLLLILIA